MFSPFAPVEIEQTISRRFATCARSHAEKIAIRYDNRSITYRALDDRANRIANAVLKRLGDGKEVVALLLGPGISAVAGILGLLKAGKAYLPIDPWISPEQVAKQLEAYGAHTVLTDETLGASLLASNFCRDRVFLIDDLAADGSSSDPEIDFAPDRLAYVFSTSGTTGEPKGVADCHRNVLHNVMRYTNSLEIGTADHLSLIQPWTFSGTVSSLLSALLNGATLCLYNLRRDGLNRLASWVGEERISIFHSVPTLFEHLVAPREDLSSLRIIRLEGDTVFPHHIDLFNESFDERCVLVNGLGATETGLTCQYFVTHGSKLPGDIVPVGYATEDMGIAVLDSDGNEVLAGQVGEICIRSRYLAVGYVGRPNLDRERFRVNAGDETLRTYLTGDRGRLDQDGCLVYLGRGDSAIRIRGQSVDGEALEAALRRFPEIEQALVAHIENSLGHASLVAYVVPDRSRRLSFDAMREKLRENFPEHAVPTKLVCLEAFPVTPSGKIDRAGLPTPTNERPPLDVPYVDPSDIFETQLKKIWLHILDVRPIGIRDNFFDLGGDSLVATEMLLMIESLFGVSLTLNTLWLESTTIEELAAHLRGSVRAGFWKNPVPIQPYGDKRMLFCVHTGGGDFWSYRHIAQFFEHDRPIFGLPARGADGSEKADATVEGMAQNCVEMMRREQPDGPYMIVGFSSAGIIAFETARMIEGLGLKVGLLAVIDSPPHVNSVPEILEFIWTFLKARRPRLVQERLYQVILAALGLSRWRVFKTIGEAHRWALWRYRGGRYGAPVTLICSESERSTGRLSGMWARLGASPLDVHIIDAPGHDEIIRAPHAREVAAVIRGAADRADLAEA